MALSDAKGLQAELDYFIEKMYSASEQDVQNLINFVNNELPRRFATAESVPTFKETTSTDFSPISISSSPTPKSSLTSAQISTTKGKGLEPYWNELCSEISSRLLLPVETDLFDLGLNSLSTWLEVTVRVVQPL
ncbi:hypothetical protein BJP34_07115 [Moorena producens PAL-8-15-08-1]|uniref:Uncharacterized protein n=1 Tax=Moorena producens PAL-8-15-08-1 TaxID=1458985 RepID=A0A1D8TNM9_9CYAN|nr:hypothetical protein BJP34_07115 [Moorena producens PAL-8-15-08-1]